MSKMTMDNDRINKAMEMSLLDSVLLLKSEILKITPRDYKRPPIDPSRRVTGSLKRSVSYEQVGQLEFEIGTQQGEAEYGKFLEFGTPNMAPRSFLRKGIIDNKDKILKNFEKRFKQVINS